MKHVTGFVSSALISGLLIVIPVYLAILLLLKAMQSVTGLARPVAMLLPEWVPAEGLISLVLILIVCFFIGLASRSAPGRVIRERAEKSLFERIPGYALFAAWVNDLPEGKRRIRGNRHWSEIEMPSSPHSSLNNWTTDDSRSSCRQSQRLSLEPCTFLAGSESIRSTSLSLRRSNRFPSGDTDQRICRCHETTSRL